MSRLNGKEQPTAPRDRRKRRRDRARARAHERATEALLRHVRDGDVAVYTVRTTE
jgi:hypothetical protein